MIRKLSVAIAVALSLAACASATKRAEQGRELQLAGRPAEAAERYIQALKKDQKLDSARVGLRTAGSDAIAGYLAAAASPSTPPDRAADYYIAADDLSKRALEVGIFLVVPSDYEFRKRATFDKAIEAAIADAKPLAASRQYADAVNHISHALRAYHPSQNQEARMGAATADVALAWARADTAAGSFRAAYGRVDQLDQLPGVTSVQTSDARALQSAALARGTKRVAILPPTATFNGRRELPQDALLALGDAFLANPWQSPPAFVGLLPMDRLTAALRAFGVVSRTMSTAQAANLARVLGADLVVVTEIDSVRRDDVLSRSTRRPVRTRSGIDTAYIIQEGQSRLYTAATFVVIDQSGQRSDYFTVPVTVNAPFTRAVYNGDYRQLDLRQSDRDYFARGANDAELVSAFVTAMSPRLAEAVFAQVLRGIP